MKCRSVACLWSRAPPSHRVTATASLTNPPTLYTGGSDGSIIWWSISSSSESNSVTRLPHHEIKPIAMLCGHTSPIVDLAICDPTILSSNGVVASDNGNADPFVNCCALISACTDGVLCVWSRSSGQCRKRRKLPPWVGSPSILSTLPSEPRYVCVGCSYIDVDGAETLADTDFQKSRCTVVVVDTYTLTIVHTVFHGNLSIGCLNFMGVVQLDEQESLLMADSFGRLQLVSVSEKSEPSKGSLVSRNWLSEGEIAVSVITRGDLVAFFSKSRCVFWLLNREEAIGEISFVDDSHSSNFLFKEAMILYSSTSTIEGDKDDSISETFVLWDGSGSAVLFTMSYIDGEFTYKNFGEIVTAPDDKRSVKSTFCFVQLRQNLLRVESSCCDVEQPSQWRPHITIWSLCLGNGKEKELQRKVLGESSYFADWISSSCLDPKGSVSAETGTSQSGSQCSAKNDLQSFVSDNGQCVSSSMVISENMYVPYAVVYGFFSGEIEIAKFDFLHGIDSPASSPRSDTDPLVYKQRLLGHTGSVLCLAAHRMFGDANGCNSSHVLISGSMDCTIRIWDLESGNVIMIMHHHVAPVRQIILSPARTKRPWSKCFLSVGDDSCVALSSLETLRVERMFPGHPNYPTKVVWDGTRGYIACLFRSLSRKSDPIDVLYIWDVKTGARERVLHGAASHSMFDHFCAGISEKSHSGTVLNGNTSVSSLLFPVDEERKPFYLKNYERAASLSTSKPSSSQEKTREESSTASSFLQSISYPPIKCTCPFPGISTLIFDLSSLAVYCQTHEDSDMHKMLEEKSDKATAQQKTSKDKSPVQKTLDNHAEVVHMDKAIGEYLIRFSLSFLHLWGIDYELDQMLVAHLKLKRPESFIVTSGLQGDKGSLTLAFPGLNATLELWKSSSEFTALRSVIMVSLAQCMISLSHSTATYSSNLAAFYTRNLAEKYPDLKPPLLQLLVTFWQDNSEQVRMAARSLFHHTASLAIPLPLCSDHASEHAELVRSLSGISLNEPKVLSTGEEYPTNSLDSEHIHQAQRLSQAEESEILSWLESFEMQDWISCVGGTSQDAMAAHIIVAAALSIWYPSLVKPGLAMLVVHKLLNLVMAMSEKYSSTAAELLSEGMETTWKTWIGPDIPRIVSDIFFQIECVSSSVGAYQVVPSSIKETLVEVLLPSLAMADVLGFLSIIESQIWSTASDSPVHVVSLRTLIRIIRAAPRNLVLHLEKAVNFVLQTMDPSNTVMRKTCLQTSMATLREVVRVFPMVILNDSSTRLAIGDVITEIDNACIRIYDMRSMTKIRVLDASGPPGLPNFLRGASESAVTTAISALSFSPDGEGLVAFSENGLMIRWWSLGSVWWEKLSQSLTRIQCTKLIFIHPWDGFSSSSSRTSVISSISNDEQELPLQETAKNISHVERLKQLVQHLDLSYRLEWASERKVVLTRHNVELGTCLL
ncbi:putative transcription factor WD40-like family [Arabidopsis thaliana]|uniref:Uncharacterized protein n=2 Tax=Arabidopsis TaxID=3701 RepID=A0A178V1M2_ARATH|nr:WD40-repeat-containing domain superfamily [Arabidopsis thaliana x Arabidopsis arenosa]OAP00099.1 hypothetical protein AXX17_AT4G12700 [Arabidopsis thaliana]